MSVMRLNRLLKHSNQCLLSSRKTTNVDADDCLYLGKILGGHLSHLHSRLGIRSIASEADPEQGNGRAPSRTDSSRKDTWLDWDDRQRKQGSSRSGQQSQQRSRSPTQSQRSSSGAINSRPAQNISQNRQGARPQDRPQDSSQASGIRPWQNRPAASGHRLQEGTRYTPRPQRQGQGSSGAYGRPGQQGPRPYPGAYRGRSTPQNRPPGALDPEDFDATGGAQQRRERRRRNSNRFETPGDPSALARRPPRNRPINQRGQPGAGRSGPPSRRPANRRYPSERRSNRISASLEQAATPDELFLLRERGQYLLDEDEPMALIHPKTKARIRSHADMPRSEKQWEDEMKRISMMDHDPVINFSWNSPVRTPQLTPEIIEQWYQHMWLETQEGASTENFEEHWQEVKNDVIDVVDHRINSVGTFYGMRHAKADEEELIAMRDLVPTDDPWYDHVTMTVHELNRNPWWTHQQKQKYVHQLLRHRVQLDV